MQTVKIADLMAQSGVGFGTSGARGRVEDMTPEVCYAYTRAFLQYLATVDGLPTGCEVALAGDLRASTPGIMAAVACAIRDAGHAPVNCGFIPSPAVALFGIERAIPSIMVTGSHIPDDRNGIKFNKVGGEILKPDEEGIRAQAVELPRDLAARLPGALPPESPAARDVYVQRYVNFFGVGALQGLKIGLYEHSGVGRDLLYEILMRLGADTLRLGRSDRFIPVDTEAVRPEDVELARQWGQEHGLDALVSTDGDADRPLIGDERGEWLRGDVAGVLCARYLGIQRLVTPVSSNTVVEKSGWFERVLRTKIGSPYVIEGMQALIEPGVSVAGYEANGGFLLATEVARNGQRLSPLPTRDAVIVALALLADAREQGIRLSELVARLPPRFTVSDRLKAFPTEQSRACIARLLDTAGRPDMAAIEQAFGELCGPVAETDTTDGLRIGFRNGEIVHLRPSGNAPEFRCYNEADSAERVGELNRACMGILAGWRS